MNKSDEAAIAAYNERHGLTSYAAKIAQQREQFLREAALDTLVSELPVNDGQHGIAYTVWFSANDGCWKWASEN